MKIKITGYIPFPSSMSINIKNMPLAISTIDLADDIAGRDWDSLAYDDDDLDEFIAKLDFDDIDVDEIHRIIKSQMCEAIIGCDESIIKSVSFVRCTEGGCNGYDYYVDFEFDDIVIREAL